jgi:hypothetical protein
MNRNLVLTGVAAAAIGVGAYYYFTQKSTVADIDGAPVPLPPAIVAANAVNIAKSRNHAFVFIKPHANTKTTQDHVFKTLFDLGINISAEVCWILLHSIDSNNQIFITYMVSTVIRVSLQLNK